MTSDKALRIAKNIRDTWLKAFNARAFGELAGLYDDDAMFFGSAPDLHQGRAAIRGYFDALPKGIALVAFPDPRVRVVARDVITTSGFWTFELDGRPLEFRLSWTLVGRDDAWLIAQHHAGLKPPAVLA
jgi:uncharacterized protein (TIGR02246 family)